MFLGLVFLIILISIVVMARRRKREGYVVNSPDALSLLQRLSEATRDMLGWQEVYHSGVLEPLNRRNVYSEFTMQEGNRSYTENKKRIVICLRKSSTVFYSWNSLMYVVCHEVAHVICDELHHTEKFHTINAALLKRAEDLGYYDPKVPFESNYCGL